MSLNRYQRLVEEHQHRLFTYARYYLKSTEEAEDVTQDVMLKLWNHLSELEEETVAAWLTRVTRNACLDQLRRRGSRGKVFEERADAGELAPRTDSGINADTRAQRWDMQRHIRQALDELEDPYRTIVILREIQGFKYTEIAAALEMPLNTVKTYLHRARRRLRQHLREVHCYAEPA